MIVGKF